MQASRASRSWSPYSLVDRFYLTQVTALRVQCKSFLTSLPWVSQIRANLCDPCKKFVDFPEKDWREQLALIVKIHEIVSRLELTGHQYWQLIQSSLKARSSFDSECSRNFNEVSVFGFSWHSWSSTNPWFFSCSQRDTHWDHGFGPPDDRCLLRPRQSSRIA